MKRLIEFIRNEPAILGAVAVVILNIFGYTLTVEGATALEALTGTAIENLAILAGGGVVRQNVTPIAKLRGDVQ